MNIKLVSDLHLDGNNGSPETLAESLASPLVDILVIAGDMTESDNPAYLDKCFNEFCKRFPQVIFVAGNHEYWHKNPETVIPNLRKFEEFYPNLKILDNEFFEINGKRFYGGTSWYSLDDFGKRVLFYNFADSWCINGGFGKVRDFINKTHSQFREGLHSLKKDDIVITHHAPNHRSIPEKYARNPFNDFYVNKWENWVWEKEPGLWMHGHIHQRKSYMFNKTWVQANPRGWFFEKTRFEPDLLITVP